MSLTDIVRTVAKNVRQTVSDPGELKEKAKDLPLNVLQTALTGVGQALMLSDRVRTRLRNLIIDRDADERTAGDSGSSPWATATEESPDKPARREPVIFAPRPSQAPAAEPSNGAAAKPSATTAKPATPPTEATAAETTAPAAPVKVAAPAEAPKPAAPAAPAAPVATVAPEPAAPAPAPAPAPAAPASATPAPAAPATAEPATTLPEPLPGYSGLTVASLRARLRGKSAAQVRELLEYEQATTARPEVVQMFGKRLAKLESGE
ncbi:hypothetical protein ABGB17_36955 [Sphaerisporangium sp. B11E5]|uniref:hypothetical protein n=1 Tax=Sphaerisporangium sp. B11E5 TaxID=3153563 RepID=UPI00325CF4FD